MSDNAPTYSIVPDTSDVNAIERDLSFHPGVVQDPQTLAKSDVDQFNRDGYLKCIKIFDDDEIRSHREYFDDLVAKVIAKGGDSYSISSAHLTYPHVYDLLTEPRIVSVVKDLLGENVIGWGSHFFCKMPHDGKAVTWHQDASYWPLTPSKTVTVWLAIDDADRENACMRFIPKSHHQGHLTFRPSTDDERNVLDQTVENAEQYGDDPIDVELQAGEISVHSDLLLHGSEANDSDRRRCGLTLRYCAADVVAHLGWNLKGVVVSGHADAGHWPGAKRPQSPDQ